MTPQLPPAGLFRDEKQLADHVLEKLGEWFDVEREVTGRYWTGEPVRIDAVLRPKDTTGWHDQAPALGIEFKQSGATGYEAIAQAVSYSHCRWDGYEKIGVFLCPGPLTVATERAREANARRQERLSPQELERYRQDARNYGLRYGKVYTERRVEYLARKRHREELGDLRYEEFLARAEGFDNLAAHEDDVALRVQTEQLRLVGHLGVGELLPYEDYGWTFTRSGHRIWSQHGGVTEVPWALGPRIGSSRR